MSGQTKLSYCGSCGEPIYWLQNEKTRKPAPIETKWGEGGNLSINTLAGTYRVLPREDIEIIRKAFEQEGVAPPLHLNHFATCPQAPAWKKAGRS